MYGKDDAGLVADDDQQAEENPGFLDTLLTILENEQNPGIRLSGMFLRPLVRGGFGWIGWERLQDWIKDYGMCVLTCDTVQPRSTSRTA